VHYDTVLQIGHIHRKSKLGYGGLFWLFRRRPHLDPKADLARRGSPETWHSRFRPYGDERRNAPSMLAKKLFNLMSGSLQQAESGPRGDFGECPLLGREPPFRPGADPSLKSKPLSRFIK
jgi:hypothetical protein